MKVSDLMVPAERGITIVSNENLRHAIELMLRNNVGYLVVLKPGKQTPEPLGILTQTDMLRAYEQEMAPDTHKVSDLALTNSDRTFITCTTTTSRDEVAKLMQKKHTHYAVVFDAEDKTKLAGLLTSYDVAIEFVREGKAWPWAHSEKDDHHAQAKENTEEHKKEHHHHRKKHGFSSVFKKYLKDEQAVILHN